MEISISIIANSQVSYDSMGGNDKIFIELAKVWKRLSYSLAVFGCSEAQEMCKRADLGVSFKKVSSFDVERIGLFFSYALRTVTSLFHKSIIKSGLIYSSSDFLPDALFAFWQKILNKNLKWIAGIFLIAPNPFKVKSSRTFKGIIYWLTQHFAIQIIRLKADLVATLCLEDKGYIVKMGISKGKVVVISGGVDLNYINLVPEAKKEYEACFIGRFHAQKGLPELIEIWHEVTMQIPNARLAIIGWGDSHWGELLENTIIENNLSDNIKILGFLDNDDKYKVLKASRIFLFPSSYESWGIVIAEAFGCGCPVVAFEIDATKKFKDGIILVKLGDIDEFAKAIITLLRDEKLYSELSQLARAAAKGFSWEKSSRIILERFEACDA